MVATGYEGVLFGFALFRTCKSNLGASLRGERPKAMLQTILLHDNILYFFGVACLLIFNNLMVVVGHRNDFDLRFVDILCVAGKNTYTLVQLWVRVHGVIATQANLSLRPFHASIGILTSRMLLHLRKATAAKGPEMTTTAGGLEWAHSASSDVESRPSDPTSPTAVRLTEDS